MAHVPGHLAQEDSRAERQRDPLSQKDTFKEQQSPESKPATMAICPSSSSKGRD